MPSKVPHFKPVPYFMHYEVPYLSHSRRAFSPQNALVYAQYYIFWCIFGAQLKRYAYINALNCKLFKII